MKPQPLIRPLPSIRETKKSAMIRELAQKPYQLLLPLGLPLSPAEKSTRTSSNSTTEFEMNSGGRGQDNVLGKR